MNGSALTTYYRPTPWPGRPLSEPTVMSFRVHGEAPWVHLEPHAVDDDLTARPWEFTVPENACEQVIARTDVSAFESLLATAVALGGDVVPVRRIRWRDVLSPHRGPLVIDQNDQYSQVVSSWSEALGWGSVTQPDLLDTNPASDVIRIHAAEMAGRIWMLQSALGGVSGTVPMSDSSFGQTEFPDPAAQLSTAWVSGSLSLFLGIFSPHVRIDRVVGDQVQEGRAERTGWPPTALEVAALQLYNALGRGDDWRICRFCENPFSSQVGRSRYGELRRRRSTAVYCRVQCQKADEQRNRRAARKRAKLEEESRVLPASRPKTVKSAAPTNRRKRG